MNWLLGPFRYSFMQSAGLAAIMVAITCATLGVYVVLRRMAFIGDALSHTVLPGLVIAYLNSWNLFGGAIVAGVATSLAIGWGCNQAANRSHPDRENRTTARQSRSRSGHCNRTRPTSGCHPFQGKTRSSHGNFAAPYGAGCHAKQGRPGLKTRSSPPGDPVAVWEH